jgi:hypothetical protein
MGHDFLTSINIWIITILPPLQHILCQFYYIHSCQKGKILVFEEILMMRDFEELIYWRLCIIFVWLSLNNGFTKSFVCSSFDNSKNNFKNNSKNHYLISKPNYLSLFFLIHQHQYEKQINMLCLFMSMIFILNFTLT